MTVLELFDQRRQLFIKELHAIVDYARDSLLGTDEFKRCLRQKLQVSNATLPDDQLNALCGKLFPPAFPRVSYEELMRLFNGTSTLHHTLKLIAQKKTC
ncbi:hypothetical protein STCU_11007 [Strigomonas culicis]|nr:hypothetical protein STCU_11007 [Strigomonas culicis]|eukprot:EPY16766.1 hypothetical protein STCU_11007 [Strigomonas culicis]